MSVPLRILHLEDSAIDAELVRARLEQEEMSCVIDRVETREEYCDRLDQGGFDVILADYSLPSFDGLSALGLAREKHPDIPFLFVSGTIGEDRAVEAYRSGATDYVLKAHLSRLAPAIKRALEEAETRSERRRAEQELRASVQLWNNTFDAMNDAISIMDERGTILRCNKAMIQLLDRYPQDIVDHPCWEVVHRTDERVAGCPFVRMKQTLRRETMTQQLQGRWFQITADPFIDQAGVLVGGVHIMTDMTEHRLAEQRLVESESKFRSLAEQSLVGTYIIQDDLFQYVNPRFGEIFGYAADDIIGTMHPLELVVPDDRSMVNDNIRRRISGETAFTHYEFRGLRRNGEVVTVEIYGSRAMYQGRPAIVGVVLDVTEKTKLQYQLLQAQKMEAVGQLTGGIAHDFNNILSAIVGYGSLLQMKLPPDDPNAACVDQIMNSADRAANLTRSLLTFSRKQITTFVPVDLNAGIRRVQNLLRRVIGEDIDLRTELAPGELVVSADIGQIEQVLMNLATNARDAMPKGGMLSLATGTVSGEALGVVVQDPGRRFALISVSDTGTGMDETVRRKIFEPFFSTKDLGRGTGLGLSMVYGIIKQHHGAIHCYSEPGRGTTFKIYLPLGAEPVMGRDGGHAAPAREELPRGVETVLVAEDDESLRKLVVTTLETFGYTVIIAVDGEDAVRQFQQHQDRIRLVVCDVIMPKKSGGEACEEIGRLAPGVRVLFMSGYPADVIRQRSIVKENAEVLLKPMTPSALLKKVRDVLDRQEAR